MTGDRQMVTIDRIREGIMDYAQEEFISRLPGLRKWAVALALPSYLAALEEMLRKNLDAVIRAGYASDDGLVDAERIFAEARAIADKTGSVTEHFPVIGDVTFSGSDIDSLRRHIGI